MSRNERAEGLETVSSLERSSRRPRQEMLSGRSFEDVRFPGTAAMRSEVAVWESSLLWRRTDDEHSTCALRQRECSTEVFNCRHYALGQCTDETSADKPSRHRATRLQHAIRSSGNDIRIVEAAVTNAATYG